MSLSWREAFCLMDHKHIFSDLKSHLGQFTLLLHRHRPQCTLLGSPGCGCSMQNIPTSGNLLKIHPLLEEGWQGERSSPYLWPLSSIWNELDLGRRYTVADRYHFFFQAVNGAFFWIMHKGFPPLPHNLSWEVHSLVEVYSRLSLPGAHKMPANTQATHHLLKQETQPHVQCWELLISGGLKAKWRNVV